MKSFRVRRLKESGYIAEGDKAWWRGETATNASENIVKPMVTGALLEGGSTVVLRLLRASPVEEMTTLYRSISKAEAESIESLQGKLSLGKGLEAKQFWQTKEGLEGWNKTALAGEYNLEITVPKSMIGNGKPINTAVQVDGFIGPNATIDRSQIEAVNQSIKSYKITPIKKD